MAQEVLVRPARWCIITLCSFLLFFLLSFARCPHAGAQGDDALEVNNAGLQNDTPQQATRIDPGEYPGLICNDADWYRVSIPASGGLHAANLRARISFDHTIGDLDMVLYDAKNPVTSYNYLDTSTLTADEEVVSASIPPGDYLIKVYGYQGVQNSSYTLTVTIRYACQSAPYEWIEIGDEGQVVPLADDDSWVIQDIGFDFPFFGGSYDRVEVSSNGYLTFADEATPGYNPASPTPVSPTHKNAPADSIFACWMNLRPDLGGGVYYRVDDADPACKRLVIEWRDIPLDASGAGVTFQAVLYECTGQVLLQYKDVTFLGPDDGISLGAGATVGINDGRKTARSANRLGTQYLYREALLADHMALLFTPSLDADLRVLRTFPQENAADVPSDQGIELVFSQHLDAATVSGAVGLTPPVSGTWTVDGNILRFSPDGASLEGGTSYEAAIDGAMLRDVFGNTLAGGADYILSFRTGEGPGTGITPLPNIAVAPLPAAHNFGSRNVGQASSPFMITLSNTGNGSLVVSGITQSNTVDFDLDLAAGPYPLVSANTTITSNSSGTLSVSFTPKSAGTKALVLSITSNDPDTPTFTFAFQGIGLDSTPNIQTSPASHAFGGITAGEVSDPTVFSITNTGNAPLDISSITLSNTNDFTLDTSGGSQPIGATPIVIPPDQGRSLTISFTPQAAGEKSATLTIASSDPDTPSTTITLQGTAVGPSSPHMEISPASAHHDFGYLRINGTPGICTITITNAGNADLVIYTLALSNGVDFSLHASAGAHPIGNVPTSISPDEFRTLAVSFIPQAVGTAAATLTITSNDPDVPSLAFSFQGTGTDTVEGWSTYGPDTCFGADACLSSPDVTSLLDDHHGTLWMGTRPYTMGNQTTGGGVCAYNRSTGALVCLDEDDGLQGSTVIDIAMGPQGAIWVATDADIDGQGAGVSRYGKDGTVVGFGPEEIGMGPDCWITDIDVDTSGHLWIATSLCGLIQYDETDWVTYSTSGENIFAGEPLIMTDDSITGILCSSTGELYIGTWAEGLFIKAPDGNSRHIEASSAGTYIATMAEDASGNLWYSWMDDEANHLVSMAPGGSPFSIAIPSGLAAGTTIINDLAIDPAAGDILIASDTGFYTYDGQVWTMFDASNSGLESCVVNTFF
ncbi:MAG: choice-of-anchor D domain-containing protein, partial [bacterium]